MIIIIMIIVIIIIIIIIATIITIIIESEARRAESRSDVAPSALSTGECESRSGF